MKNSNIFSIIMITLFITSISFCYASPLEDAKQIVDDYYRYSMEKDIDSYINLFDKEYLQDIYGPEHETLIKEVFNYFEIKDYEIDYQYYTESNESLTLFFNLESDVIIDGQKIHIDNDLVSFFSKSNQLKLRFIILQEEFIGQMNREVIYKTAVANFIEKESDLKVVAEKEGISLVDYKSIFEERINSHHNKSKLIWFIIIILIAITVSVYLVKTGKIDKKKSKIHLNIIRKHTIKTWDYLNKEYKNNWRKHLIKGTRIIRQYSIIIMIHTKRQSIKTWKWLTEKYRYYKPIIIANTKKIFNKINKKIKDLKENNKENKKN